MDATDARKIDVDKDKTDIDKDKDAPDKDKDDLDKEKTDEEKNKENAKELAAARAYIGKRDSESPSPDVDVVLAHINANPATRIKGKPYKKKENSKGPGHYDIYYNPSVYWNYTDGYFGNNRERDFDPREDDRFEDLSKEEGKNRPSDIIKGKNEAEEKGLVQNPRRPTVSGPDLDFEIDGPPPYKWCDVKTPVDPNLRSLEKQADDIAKNIFGQKAGADDVLHVVDLKNVPLDARDELMKNIIDKVGSSEGIFFID